MLVLAGGGSGESALSSTDFRPRAGIVSFSVCASGLSSSLSLSFSRSPVSAASASGASGGSDTRTYPGHRLLIDVSFMTLPLGSGALGMVGRDWDLSRVLEVRREPEAVVEGVPSFSV